MRQGLRLTPKAGLAKWGKCGSFVGGSAELSRCEVMNADNTGQNCHAKDNVNIKIRVTVDAKQNNGQREVFRYPPLRCALSLHARVIAITTCEESAGVHESLPRGSELHNPVGIFVSCPGVKLSVSVDCAKRLMYAQNLHLFQLLVLRMNLSLLRRKNSRIFRCCLGSFRKQTLVLW